MRALRDGLGAFLTVVGLGLLGRWVLQQRRESDLWGEVALVTGGSRGLGFLLARELAREGCRIAICARDQRELNVARSELEREGTEVLAVRCDVSVQEQVEQTVQEVTAHFGRIDTVVNVAGIIQVGPVESMTVEDFEQAMGVMFWGTLYPTLAVLPQMMGRRSGRIVNITSIGGIVSVPHLLPYNAAKFAAVGTSQGLHAELSQHGIKVTTVIPGLMRTGSHLNARFKGRKGWEFTWFSLGASLPLISMDAERAARQIVQAVKRGDAEIILSLPAKLLAMFHGLFPGTTVRIFSLVNRFLPSVDPGQTGMRRGSEAQAQINSRILDALTALGRSAARRYQHLE